MLRQSLRLFALLCVGQLAPLQADPVDLRSWQREPHDWNLTVHTESSIQATHDRWGYLKSPMSYGAFELTATVTIVEPAKSFRFFGESWSVWPDQSYSDGGFEAGLLLRGSQRDEHPRLIGYRVLVSHKWQQLVLVKFPEGGYLRSVPCEVKQNVPQTLAARVEGQTITILVDGQEKLRYHDTGEVLPRGQLGVGIGSASKVLFTNIAVRELPDKPLEPVTLPLAHTPHFSVRTWLGDRPWVFDGDEPIMQLPATKSSYINNVKLRPGVRPLLSWNSHWDTQNQGAYKEATNDTTDVQVQGKGEQLTVTWRGEHASRRFGTQTRMTIGYDTHREVYTYDVESELTVFPGEPFLFRYGYDFEHHTPLDPFNWQYLIARRRGGELYYRPVYPIDPGPQADLEPHGGVRVWYGRHHHPTPISPAVEYSMVDTGKRQLNTAVCAAFYDTGVSFPQELAPPGTQVRVRYRYTGYPQAEAERLFTQAQIYRSAMLDPEHHYIFAEWPRQSFALFEPLSKSWAYGRVPFMTGHNRRPTYELARDPHAKSGFAMKLGPLAYGSAALPIGEPLSAGNYMIVGKCKADNACGNGGRLELTALDKSGQTTTKFVHHVGNGTFAWQTVGCAFTLTHETKTLTLGLGNGGTGDLYFADVEVRRLENGEKLPAGVANEPSREAPRSDAIALSGLLVDYRMREGKGHHVLNHASSDFGLLELANVAWEPQGDYPALSFRANPDAKQDFAPGGKLALDVFTHPGNVAGKTASFALAGTHGGGREYRAFSLITWANPDVTMHNAYWGSDIVGLGARRVKLSLKGNKPPYQFGASLNFTDFIWSDVQLDAQRWYQLALTGEAQSDRKWLLRLYVDGRLVQEAKSQKVAAPMLMPSSLVLGTELFYLNSAYYHGRIGRTLVFERALTSTEICDLKP